jgi:hypothetical protein
MKLKLKGRRFDTIEEIDQSQIPHRAWHSNREGLPGSVPKMEDMVRPVSTCGREPLREWWWLIGLMVNFMILILSVWNILDGHSCWRLTYFHQFHQHKEASHG